MPRKPTAAVAGLPADYSRPQVGQVCTVRQTQCRITAVHGAGTMDVVSLDGRYAWRLTGLAFR